MQLRILSLIAGLLATTVAQTTLPTSATSSVPPTAATSTTEPGVFPSIWNRVTSGIASVPSNIRNATNDVFGNSGEEIHYSTGMMLIAGSLTIYQLI
ncbi:hypothetical protein K7432_006655 [Basidiobolus ranarum]|uniref:Uncharacterized protein n=1 Tax=Basidiobolus ranarum TaxID=34480 RepID=A0ABR2WUI8_9FUNG